VRIVLGSRELVARAQPVGQQRLQPEHRPQREDRGQPRPGVEDARVAPLCRPVPQPRVGDHLEHDRGEPEHEREPAEHEPASLRRAAEGTPGEQERDAGGDGEQHRRGAERLRRVDAGRTPLADAVERAQVQVGEEWAEEEEDRRPGPETDAHGEVARDQLVGLELRRYWLGGAGHAHAPSSVAMIGRRTTSGSSTP
jgi:hypothetical protein